ncbi:MAG: YdcF family protein [Bacteroidota bacterium]
MTIYTRAKLSGSKVVLSQWYSLATFFISFRTKMAWFWHLPSLRRRHYWLIIFPTLASCAVFHPPPSKLFVEAIKNKPYDVIIVPGMPYDGKAWTTLMKGRVRWSSYLIREGIAKNVIYSGAAVYTPYVEAKILALYGQALGIPKDKIFLETQAQHSTENIYYSYQLAQKLGFTKIAIATDPVQSAMLMGFSKRRFKLPITHIPIMVDTLETMDVLTIDPLIKADSAYVDNFVSIVDRLNKWQRFKGTFGRSIPYKKEY